MIIMHIKTLLHKILVGVTHKKRVVSLVLMIEAALLAKQLSVTKLGRSLVLKIQERSCIRRSDRLIGNEGVYQDRKAIYERNIKLLVGSKTRPIIIVDWSNIPNSEYNTLRAALVTDGRALTLYEEVHPLAKLGNAKVQRGFLYQLKKLLEVNCRPIIVTDAGFHNPWFKAVLKLGWDYIGRVRGQKSYLITNTKEWQQVDTLCKGWNRGPAVIGEIKLCKENTIITQLYASKDKVKVRDNSQVLWLQKKGNRSTRNHRKAAKECLVLVSSLRRYGISRKIIAIYKRRMQIEEAFRDLKSSRYGFGFEQAYSRSSKRITVLLLIAMLAALIAWLVGLAAESINLQYQFQANSLKHRRVLSLFFLGCQIIKRKLLIPIKVLRLAMQDFYKDIYATI